MKSDLSEISKPADENYQTAGTNKLDTLHLKIVRGQPLKKNNFPINGSNIRKLNLREDILTGEIMESLRAEDAVNEEF